MSDPRPPRVPRLLLVEDDELVVRKVARSLRKAAEIEVAWDAGDARERLARRTFDIVAADLRLPDGDGASLLGEAQRLQPGAQFVLFSAIEPTPESLRTFGSGRLVSVLGEPEGLAEFVALVNRWSSGDA